MVNIEQVCAGWESVVATRRVFYEKVFLNNFVKLTGNHYAGISSSIKFKFRPATSLKNTNSEVFSCELRKICNNNFSHRTPTQFKKHLP